MFKLFFPLLISPQIIIYLYILCYLEMQRERTNASASNSLRITSGNAVGFSLSKERLMYECLIQKGKQEKGIISQKSTEMAKTLIQHRRIYGVVQN